ncbi:MAG: DUF4062 domain-containing protein [Lachnospiraceae bacterium]|nr:DUF4062 domain-containing protein [Lachnospiraceae bacterium]
MKRYQVFISSTYTDLQLERQAVLESVLKLRHIPVGMEHFVSTNEEQFNYIKRLLDETDYYIIIIGNRYGSQADDGISYTEKEFDYAVHLGIPVIACIHSNPDSLPVNKSDIEPDAKQKLNDFRNKVMHHRMVSYFSWDNPSDLSAEVVVALVNTINDYPRPGWERVVSYENSDLLNQINDLRIENDRMKVLLDSERQSEKHEQLIMQFPWSETHAFMGYSKWDDYKNISIPVSLTWSQIFSILGPILLVENSTSLVHYALNHALFLDHEPYFCVPDVEFQLIIAEFLKYGIIDIAQDKVTLTKAGKQGLHTIRGSVDKELDTIHTQVMEVLGNIPQKSNKEISEYIRRLSNFNSNPEATDYIGETLLGLRVFLGNQTEWDKEQVEIAQKEIEDILNEAFESERVEMSTFDPIFNLSKIMKLIDFLNTKLQEIKTINNQNTL